MHEASLARAIIASVSEALDERHIDPRRVRRIHLDIGELAQVDVESLEFAFGFAVEESSLRTSSLVIASVPAVLACTQCGSRNLYSAEFFFTCPLCQGACVVEAGKEFDVVGLDLDDAELDDDSGHFVRSACCAVEGVVT
ncbi:hydrogenase maturation nickel metallochaperone HypA [Ferrimicrobium sp.]|uniref:hydrogenase maturation nickel metallochaperone HypA/HybF n=1 Tax=Ferrimicrobium sp. TaxID=2926050 RepID=UPI00262F8E16|nr:hydrogenase maturation nickel metallochaperone HypA [Ferrimicrobium sp.]